MDEKEDDATSETANSDERPSIMGGVTIGKNEQRARDIWMVYFADRGIYRAKHMIDYIENTPDIRDQIVSDVVDGIKKDKEIQGE